MYAYAGEYFVFKLNLFAIFVDLTSAMRFDWKKFDREKRNGRIAISGGRCVNSP